MFSKVLVANRGEIAVRINQTLRALGIAPVAVYSEPDAGAPHVATAAQSVALPGRAAEETYLNIPKIVQAALDCGADAIHPGYGFRSENPEFALACRSAGLSFIGPTAESMAALGDKLRAKDIARRAGIPVAPGSPVCRPGDAAVGEFAARWGFPLLVKAAAGGGGRGMRLVNRRRDLDGDMELAGREAQAAFGDGRVFLERYIANPRHVEVQVLADGFGHTVHLGERECSIQRRHQKIVEESPSPALTPELRRRMGTAAIAVARAAGYVNAGTVEFLLDGQSGEFYFLELNARLQVEHPVTEAVLGLDLVEWQVRIASGESLTLRQEDIRPRGHAIECRIYAEDPLPRFRAVHTAGCCAGGPPSAPACGWDSGVVQGARGVHLLRPDAGQAHRLGAAPRPQLAPDGSCPGAISGAGRGNQTYPCCGRWWGIRSFSGANTDTGFLEWNPRLPARWCLAKLRTMARALAAWAAGQPAGPASPADGADSRPAVSPWQSAGPQRLP